MISTRFILTTFLALCSVSSAAPSVKPDLETRAASAKGWYSRAEAHPAGSSYVVDGSKLVCGVIRSTRLDPEHLTVSFFKPNVAIDSTGKVLSVKPADFENIAALAGTTADLPSTGQFRWFLINAYRSIQQAHSDWPIHYVSATKSGVQHVNGVYGFDGKTTKLDPAVAGYQNLPKSLNDLLSLAVEAEKDNGATTGDTTMINKVKSVIELD
ncbi:hypothetical protein RhiJN_20767 [Ceratobasidium sp. AG-Ba]|nr:hypothetical protein RhiJN_20767 [Ceratobasidium sp. AG-Ba]